MGMFKSRATKENETMLSGLVAMAMADGEVDSREISVLRGVAHKLGIKDSRVSEIFKNPNLSAMPKTPVKRALFLLFMFEMMWVDGKVTPEEAKFAFSCGLACGYTIDQVKIALASFEEILHETKGNYNIVDIAQTIANHFG